MNNHAPWSSDLDWPAHLRPFDPFDTVIQTDPYEHYRWLREHAPVIRCGRPEAPLYVVSRYDDVKAGLRNAADFASRPPGDVVIPGFLLTLDPPDHTRLRQSANRAFTPKAMAAVEPQVAELVKARWQAVLERRGGELIGEFASPLTISVIGTVLGVPVEHAEMMRQWTSETIAYIGALFRGVPATAATDAGLRQLLAYMDDVLDQAAAGGSESIVGNLAALRDERSLTREEASGFAVLLFMAGHETTTLLTGNCLDVLSGDAALLEHLRQPDTAAPFMDEMNRFRPPVHRLTRYVRRDVDVSGVIIPAGASVRFLIASANRDAAQFAAPDRFDPVRSNAPNAAFGYGIHTCIGSWLARMEVRLILQTIALTTRSIVPSAHGPRVSLVGGAFATVGVQSLGLSVEPL